MPQVQEFNVPGLRPGVGAMGCCRGLKVQGAPSSRNLQNPVLLNHKPISSRKVVHIM